jgi:hypothetical protein
VSYYAFFKGWLLPSPPPKHRKFHPSFKHYNLTLKTLIINLSYFSLDYESSHPQSD